jgi:glycosyltransferase involved in cell wall biosynthesis
LGETGLLQFSGDDLVLADLYRHASAFIYPSLYEGFGLPVLEAMAHGCPVICSGTSSLPEVVGGAAELFDPNDPESIGHAIEAVVSSAERREWLRATGRQQARLFSWERCAWETHAVYRAIS